MEVPLNSFGRKPTRFENLPVFEIERGQEILGEQDHTPTYETANALATSFFENLDLPKLDELLLECQELRAASDTELKNYFSLLEYETNFPDVIQKRQYKKAAELIIFLRRELPGFNEAPLMQQFVNELMKHLNELNEKLKQKDAPKSELLLHIDWQMWENLDPLLLPYAEYFQSLDCIFNKKVVTAELAEKYKSNAYFLFLILEKQIVNNDFNDVQNKIELFLESYSETREDPFRINYIFRNKLLGLKTICQHRTKSSFTNEDITNLEKEYFTHFNGNIKYILLGYHYVSFLIEHNLIEKLLTLFKEKKIIEDLFSCVLNVLNYHGRGDVFLTLHNDYKSELVEYNPLKLYQFYYLLIVAHSKLNNKSPFDTSTLESPALKLIAEAAVAANTRNYASMEKIEVSLFNFAQIHHDFEALARDFRCRRLMAFGKFQIAFNEMEKWHLSGKIISAKTFVILGILSQLPSNRFMWALNKLPSITFISRIIFTFFEFSKSHKVTRLNLEHLDRLFYADEPYDYGTRAVYLNVLTYIGNHLNPNENQELKFETSQKAIAIARTLLREYPFACDTYISLLSNYLGNYIDYLPDIIEEGLYSFSDKLTFISKCLDILHRHQAPSNYSNFPIRTCIFKLVLALSCFNPLPKQAQDLLVKYSRLALSFLSIPYQLNFNRLTVNVNESLRYSWNPFEYFKSLTGLVGRLFAEKKFNEALLLIPKRFPFELSLELQQTLLHLNSFAEGHLDKEVKKLKAITNPSFLIAAADTFAFFTNFKAYSIEILTQKIVTLIRLKKFEYARITLTRLCYHETLSTYHLLYGDLCYEERNFEKASYHYGQVGEDKSAFSESTLFKIVHSKFILRQNDQIIPEDLIKIILKNNAFPPAYELLFKFFSVNKITQIEAVLTKLPRTHEFYFSFIKFYFLGKKYEEVVKTSLEFESEQSIPGKEHYAFLIGEFYYKSLVMLDRVKETLEKRTTTAFHEPKALDLFFFLHHSLNLENGTTATNILHLYKQKNPNAIQNQALMGIFRIINSKCYFFEGDIFKAKVALENYPIAWSPLYIFMMSLLSFDFNKAASFQNNHPHVDPKKGVLTYWKYIADPLAFSSLKDPLKLIEDYMEMTLSDPAIEHHYLFISFLKKLKPNHQILTIFRDYLKRSPRIKDPKEVYFLINVIEALYIWYPESGLKLGLAFLQKCAKKKLIFEYLVASIRNLQKSQISFSLDPYITALLKYRLGFPAENFSQSSAEHRLMTIKTEKTPWPTVSVQEQAVPNLRPHNKRTAVPGLKISAKSTNPVFLDLTKEDSAFTSNRANVPTSAFMNEIEEESGSEETIPGPFISESLLAGRQEIRRSTLEPTRLPVSFISSDQSALPPSPQIFQRREQATDSESFSLFAENESLPLSPLGSQPMEITHDEISEAPSDSQVKIFRSVETSGLTTSATEENNFVDLGLETLGSALLSEVQECIKNTSEMPEQPIFHDQEIYPNLELIDSLSESDKELAALLEIHSHKHFLKVSREEGASTPNTRIELYRLYESLPYEGKACLAATLKMACQKFNSWLEENRIPFISSSLQKQNGVFAFSYHSEPIGELLYEIVLELSKNQDEANNGIIESAFFYFISHILRVTSSSNEYCYGEYNKQAIQNINPKLWSLIEKAGEMNASRFPINEKMIPIAIVITYKNLLSELLSHFTNNIESFFSGESFDSSVLHSRGVDVSLIYKQRAGIFAYYSCFLFDSNGFPLTTFSPSKLNFKHFSNNFLPVPGFGKTRFAKGTLPKVSHCLITGNDFPKMLFVFSKKSTITCSKNVEAEHCFPHLESFASNTGQSTREIASLFYNAEESFKWPLTYLKCRIYTETPPINPKRVSPESKASASSTIRQVSQSALSKGSETTFQRPIEARLLKTSNALENNHKRKTASPSALIGEMEKSAAFKPPVAGSFVSETHLTRPQEIGNAPFEPNRLAESVTIPSNQPDIQPIHQIFQPMEQSANSESFSLFPEDGHLFPSSQKLQPMDITPDEMPKEPSDSQEKIFKTRSIETSDLTSSSTDLANFEDLELETFGDNFLSGLEELIVNAPESEISETTSQRPVEELLKNSNALEKTHKRKAEAIEKPPSLQKGKEKETVNLLSIEEGVLEFKKLLNRIEKNNFVSFEKVRDISYLLWEYLENQMASNLPIVFYPKSPESEDALLLDLLIHPIEGKKVRILYCTETVKCEEAADYFKDVILDKKLKHFESTFGSIEKQIRLNCLVTARKKCTTLNYVLCVILDQARMKAPKTCFERNFVEKVRVLSQNLYSISHTHGFKLYSISDINDLSNEDRQEFLGQFKKPLKAFLLTSPDDLVSSVDPKAPLFVSNTENHALYADPKDSLAIFHASGYTLNHKKTLYLQSVTSLHVDLLLDLLLKSAYLTSLSPTAKELPRMLDEMRQKVSLSIKQIEDSPHEETKKQSYQCLKQWFFLQFEFISKIRSSFFDFKKQSRSFVNLILSLRKEEVTQETILNLIKGFLRELGALSAAEIAFLEEIKKDPNFDQEFQFLLETYSEPKPLEEPRFPGRWVLRKEERLKRPLPIGTIQDEGLKESLLSNNTGFDSYYERNAERSPRKKAAGKDEIVKGEPSKRAKRESKLLKREREKEAPIFPLSGFFPSWSQNDFQSSSEGLENPVLYQKNLQIFNTAEYLRLTEQALQAKKGKYKYLLEKNSTNSRFSDPLKEKEGEGAEHLELIYNDLNDIADEICHLTKTVTEVEFSLYHLKADLYLYNLNFNLLIFKSLLQKQSLDIISLRSQKNRLIEIINKCFFYLSNQHSWLKKHHYADQKPSGDESGSPYDELRLSYKMQKKGVRESIMDCFSIFPSNLAYDENNKTPLNPYYYLPFVDILTDSLVVHFKKLTELKEQENKCKENDLKKISLRNQIETTTAVCIGNFKELDFYIGFLKNLHQKEPQKLKKVQFYFDKAQEVMKALFMGQSNSD